MLLDMEQIVTHMTGHSNANQGQATQRSALDALNDHLADMTRQGWVLVSTNVSSPDHYLFWRRG